MDHVAPTNPETSASMALLEAGVPLTLLIDIMTLDPGRSRDIARDERADTGWIHAAA
jgi:hypothetical protein